jgi:hypothetical protein
MKDEWNSRLANGRDVDYSIEPSAAQIWRVTAQARDRVILHQANIKGPISRRDVEAYFRDDLVKEE